jgi:hypothetical protein
MTSKHPTGPFLEQVEPESGIEPETSSLPRTRSTPEPPGRNGAGNGIRTRDP